MKNKILKEFDERFNWEEIFGKNSKAQQSLRELFIKAIAQTREETIREVGNSIKSFFYSLDDTNDEPFNKGIIQIDLDLVDKQIKDILNKLKK